VRVGVYEATLSDFYLEGLTSSF